VIKLKNSLRVVTLVLIVAVVFSGCQASQLSVKPGTEQVVKAKDLWFKDQAGAYTATVNYDTPGGLETNTFKLTIRDGVITQFGMGITTKVEASTYFQQGFQKEMKNLIVGRRLADFSSVDVVSGASLTTAAFNDAVAKLKSQLKS